MPKVEYRAERLEQTETQAAVAQLNRWGEQGWQVIQIDRSEDGFEVWLSRELPVMAAGLKL